ncbi:MAG: nucleotidyltransferase domain-containing protein [Candidatus Hatepunaea meridiana]|nr:nucleotidyltransferase domain-containing protein [Candidatus Hatepunaea meridiana]
MDIIEERKTNCHSKIVEIKEQISVFETISNLSSLSIYVTGSYGRLEASEHSDLDVFFIHEGSEKNDRVSNIEKTLLDAELIKMCREMEFPELSGDARYLNIHYLDDLLDNLGSPADDYKNYFTARMLLILESICIHNKDTYIEIVKKIMESYYRDYHDHETDFIPVFLVNDIIRFWKTLCLNYEHKRNREQKDENEKNKAHLKNLKLKFSRLMTCFSMVLLLSKNQEVIEPSDLMTYIEMSPLERLQIISNTISRKELYLEIIGEYEWFLKKTGYEKNEVLKWISIRNNRDEAFEHARDFGIHFYKLLQEVCKENNSMRYLTI